MFDAEITSVLPSHSTDFERALEQASLWVIQNSEIVDVWNPETCPPQFLPWLAWSVSVDEWEAAWSDQKKREVIRASVAVHRLKGTKGAVRRALEAMGFGAEIVEWFENGSETHTFDIEALAEDVFEVGFGITPELYQAVSRQIDYVKPVRSHYSLRIGERFRSNVYLRSGVRSRARSRMEHDVRPRVHFSEAALFARSGLRTRAVSRVEHDIKRKAN